ncbi:hypothetical protein DFQ26_001777 [Actinomortierella ambigua]|nr:hypothetical protein DFQ26_001777 [Actinomortierella ambigua]
MKSITAAAAIAAFVALASSADATCYCFNTHIGTHCGESPLMMGCKSGYLYGCNGIEGSVAREYGLCRKLCVQEGVSRDYCQA